MEEALCARIERPKKNQRPVDPKPPLPRSVSESDVTDLSSAWTTAAITICAMRSPRRMVKGAVP
jgi:hypothetical protein